ncbi:MAG: nitroreductase family protein [Candidatus Lokiarchaeota archaeon]|nr:nitroreductase family protein [Candidatus Lokiarchaeota archaeon]
MNPEELLHLMKERRSIRKFKSAMIEEEKIQQILEAARWTQSASNRQPWRFIVIKNKETITKLQSAAKFGNFVADAPVVIAIIADKKRSPNWYIHDTSMVAHQICLMAWSLKIGTCWIGSMDRDKAAEALQIGKHEHVTTILPLGYFDKMPDSTSRKDLKNLVTTIT